MIGQVFGRLTVVSEAEPYRDKNGRHKGRRFVCLCECGVTKINIQHKLKQGERKSCDCAKIDKSLETKSRKENKAKEILSKKLERESKYKDTKEYYRYRYKTDLGYRAKILEKSKKWMRDNMPKALAKKARYRSGKYKATPPWLTEEHHEEIELMYVESRRLSKETGIKHHVDHIIPLKNDIVCGLHVPWNLRVITATENLTKNNTFELSHNDQVINKKESA
jgi:hypothetical protein